MATATLSPAMTALKNAGDKFAKANTARTEALAELQEAIRKADAEGGHPRTELVAVSGVARQTVYDALRTSSPATPGK